MKTSLIKYTLVSFSDLPAKDYAKAKFLVEHLTTGQYVENVFVSNIQDFKNYIEALTREHNLYFIIKKSEVGSSYNILNNGYTKKKENFNTFVEKFTM